MIKQLQVCICTRNTSGLSHGEWIHLSKLNLQADTA